MSEAAKVSLVNTLAVSKERFDNTLSDEGYKISKASILEASAQVVLQPESRTWIKDVLEIISPENGDEDPIITLDDLVLDRDETSGDYHFEASFRTKRGGIEFEMDKNGKIEANLTYFDARPNEERWVVMSEQKFSWVERFPAAEFSISEANRRVASLTDEWNSIKDHKERAAIIGTLLLPVLDRS